MSNPNLKEVTLGEQKLDSVTEFINTKDLQKGAELIGTYLGYFIAGKYKSRTHKVKRSDGTIIGITGGGMLNKKLEFVPVGSNVVITYLGKEEIKGGQWKGSDAHNWKVLSEQLIDEADVNNGSGDSDDSAE